jgi:hypothetical protein
MFLREFLDQELHNNGFIKKINNQSDIIEKMLCLYSEDKKEFYNEAKRNEYIRLIENFDIFKKYTMDSFRLGIFDLNNKKIFVVLKKETYFTEGFDVSSLDKFIETYYYNPRCSEKTYFSDHYWYILNNNGLTTLNKEIKKTYCNDDIF